MRRPVGSVELLQDRSGFQPTTFVSQFFLLIIGRVIFANKKLYSLLEYSFGNSLVHEGRDVLIQEDLVTLSIRQVFDIVLACH